VAAPPLVHHRALGVGPHARRTHQVPAGYLEQRVREGPLGTRRLEDLRAASHGVVEHAPAVLAHRVADLRRRHAVGVGELGIERHPVVLLGEILADHHHAGGAIEELLVGLVMTLAPGHLARRHPPQRRRDGSVPAHGLERVAAHEPPGGVGVVELLAHETAAGRTLVALEGLLEDSRHHRVGVEHEVAADEAARVGEPVRELLRARVQQKPRRADAVARHHHHLGALSVLHPVGVVVDHAVRHAVRANGDLAHPTAGLEADAASHRRGPVGDVGARLGALGAAGEARPEVDARRAPLVGAGRDGAVRGPPVPAEPIEAPCQGLAQLAEGDRRERDLLVGVGGIARQPRDPHHARVEIVVGREARVVERPVVRDTIERTHPEVRRPEAREVRGVEDGAAPDGREHGGPDR
jgi:hypothetical protein